MRSTDSDEVLHFVGLFGTMRS